MLDEAESRVMARCKYILPVWVDKQSDQAIPTQNVKTTEECIQLL